MSRARAISPETNPLPLREGQVGDAVADLQERLRRLGFEYMPDSSGVFGSATAQAVQEFQIRARLASGRDMRPPDLGEPR